MQLLPYKKMHASCPYLNFEMLHKNDPLKSDFVGGLLHVLKHFSVEGKNLATGNDINNVFDIGHIIYLIAMAFRLKKQCEKDHQIIVFLSINPFHSLSYKYPCFFLHP